MVKESVKKIYAPWDDDEIQFLDGDWQIWRDACFGLYRYIVSGIEGQEAVDAVQLIAWGMAQILCYESMTPWKRSDVSFNDKAVVIRNLIDTSTPLGKRTYLIDKDGGFLKVNKYYLILHKYATAGKKTNAEINEAVVDVCGLYPEDDIVLIPYSNVTITKARSKGLYQIKINGLTFVRDAKYLVDNEYAKSAYQARLELLSKESFITLDKLRSSTCEFWLAPDANEIITLREIARTYEKIEKGGVEEIFRRIDEIAQPLHDVERLIEEIGIAETNYRELSTKLLEIVNESTTLLKKMPKYSLSVLSNINKNELESIYTSICDNLKKAKCFLTSCQSEIEKIKAINDIKIQDISLKSKVFPKNVIPKIDELDTLTKKIKQSVLLIKEDLNEFTDSTTYKNGKTVIAPTLSALKNALSDLERTANVARDTINTVRRIFDRRERLDKIKSLLGNDRYKRKTYLFNKSYKSDRIKYTTAVKIVHVGYGRYTIPQNPIAKNLSFTAADLIYMGLAKQI